jgi:hypothetical protein
MVSPIPFACNDGPRSLSGYAPRQNGLVDQVVQIAGALLILAAFAGAQAGRLDQRSTSYLSLNLLGSAILAALAAAESQYGFLLLEGVWALISAHSLWREARGPTAP